MTPENLDRMISLEEEARGSKTETKEKQILPEDRKKIPNYTVEIYFGVHASADDIKGEREGEKQLGSAKHRGLAEEFKKSDVYIPELHGWTDLDLSRFQDVSYGRITPEQFISEVKISKQMLGFFRGELEMIYKSYKPIIILDVPQSEKSDALREHMFGEKEERFKPLSFTQFLAEIRKGLRKTAELHNDREDYMLSELTPKLHEVFERRPDLAKKPDLKVLMFLGIAHTRVARMLSNFGVNVQSRYSRSPFIYAHVSEAQRRLAQGKEVSNELAAKVFLSSHFTDLITEVARNFTEDNAEVIAFNRKIVEMFSYEEIKSLYETSLRERDWRDSINAFLDMLAKKQVPLPTNHVELVAFIS